MTHREKMSAVDTAWMRMDRPSNLMMICGVLGFAGRLDLATARRVVAERFLCFRRFRDRPVQAEAGAFWEQAPDFDVARHVVEVALPGAAGRRELQSLVSRLARTPLDPGRPLWQFHLVRRYDGGSALVMRIHHCYADGIALMQVMLSMTDVAPAGPPARSPPAAKAEEPAAQEGLFGGLAQPFAGAIDKVLGTGAALLDRGADIWQRPAKVVELAEQGGAIGAEIARLALMGQDSPTRFKGTPGVAKRVAWAPPLPLHEVKAVGRALGASVNDVLLSCVAGALRDYLVRKGDPTDGVMIRAIVPVNLRSPEKAWRLGNKFALVFLDLPLGIENPVERLYAVRANMRALKGSFQPILTYALLAAVGVGPKVLQDQVLEVLARNATAVMTNVPGPQQPLWFGGARIRELMVWVPQSGDIGLGVSILSYDGRVQFGLITDRGLCSDPERVIERFDPEFEKLLLATLLSPWPRSGDLDPAVAAAAVGPRPPGPRAKVRGSRAPAGR
jgi:diacylglycerol O-acyltransferase / wax synthase